MVNANPARMARVVPAPKESGCCGGNTPAPGPRRVDVVETNDGKIARMEQESSADPWHEIPSNPREKPKAEALDIFIDWACLKGKNFFVRMNETYYAMRSLWAIVRFGWVDHHTYHLRCTWCDHRDNGRPCRHRVTRVDSGFHYCGFEAEGCGCFEYAHLRRKLRFKGFICLDKCFGGGRTVEPVQLGAQTDGGNDLAGRGIGC